MTTKSKSTTSEMVQSLTGFEEEAIEEQYGADIGTLLRTKSGTRGLRALVHVEQVRSGSKAGDAKKHAMGLTIAQLNDHFEDEEDEPMPEEPVTEQGKESSLDS